jgi:membrane protein YdbS with pleckstrin-like domain
MPDERLVWSGHPTWKATISFFLLWGSVSAVPLALILVARAAGVDAPLSIGIAILLAGVALTVLVGWVQRRFTEYTITTERVNVRTGILAKRETTTRLSRVQNVTIVQSPFDRLFGVGTIDLDTASQDSGDTFRFHGVDRPQELRERITTFVHGRADEPGV